MTRSCLTIFQWPEHYASPGADRGWVQAQVWEGGAGPAASSLLLLAAILAAVTVIVVVSMWLRARTRLAEQRLELLRELAQRGQLSERMIDEYLAPGWWRRRGMYVMSWYALVLGVALIITAMAYGWRRTFEDVGVVGIVLSVFAFATLTVPLALAEMRRLAPPDRG